MKPKRTHLVPVLLAIAALLLAACGAGPDDDASGEPTVPVQHAEPGEGQTAGVEPSPLDPEVVGVLSAAAEKTADLGSLQMEMVISVDAPGQGAFDLTASGAFDLAGQRGRMTLDYAGLLDALGPQAGAAEGFLPDTILIDGLTMYMRFPRLKELMPDAKPWVRMDLETVSAEQGLDPSLFGGQFGQSDPTQLLAWLQATGSSVTKVGTEEVRGVSATRYSASVDLNAVPELVPEEQRDAYGAQLGLLIAQTGLTELPIDVWIDEEDRVRRLATELRMEGATGFGTGAATIGLLIDMYDFGAEVEITPPKKKKTMDFSELIQAAPVLPG